MSWKDMLLVGVSITVALAIMVASTVLGMLMVPAMIIGGLALLVAAMIVEYRKDGNDKDDNFRL